MTTTKPQRFRIERTTPKGDVLLDFADSMEDALTFASCHSENIPEQEIQIKTPSGKQVLTGEEI